MATFILPKVYSPSFSNSYGETPHHRQHPINLSLEFTAKEAYLTADLPGALSRSLKLRLNSADYSEEDTSAGVIGQALALADPENLGSAGRADPFRRRTAVLQGDLLGIPYLHLPSALEAVRLHLNHPLLVSVEL
jgi:hypothetical protein